MLKPEVDHDINIVLHVIPLLCLIAKLWFHSPGQKKASVISFCFAFCEKMIGEGRKGGRKEEGTKGGI